MVQVIEIDHNYVRRASENLWLYGADASTGAGLDGREQIMFSENRRWQGQLDFAHIPPEKMGAAYVIGDQLRGRANVLRVALCNPLTAVFAGDLADFYAALGISAAEISDGFTRYGDNSTFSDGTGFALPSSAEPTVSASALAGASEILLNGFLGRNLAAGAFFSVNDYLYRVASNDDGALTFNPPLRAAVDAGVQVDVSAPKIKVRLADGADWQPFCRYFRHGQSMSVNVVEAFDR